MWVNAAIVVAFVTVFGTVIGFNVWMAREAANAPAFEERR